MMRTTARLLPVALITGALAFGVAACGSDDTPSTAAVVVVPPPPVRLRRRPRWV